MATNPNYSLLKNVSTLFLVLGALAFVFFSFFSLQSSKSRLVSHQNPLSNLYQDVLGDTLQKASMPNKTVIITVVNRAYVEGEVLAPNMLDLFLEGFWEGEGTRQLVNHLVIVAVDQTAYERCLFRGFHCYKLETEGVDFMGEQVFMSSDFVKMMWRRTLFLTEVLERGYNFIFTDVLGETLQKASMEDKTVIIAVVNKAYVEGEEVLAPNMLDIFLEGFWEGEGTRQLVNHLVIVAVDQTAYERCLFRGLHCYKLETDGVDFMGEEVYMSSDFIKMMWRRTLFLTEVLERGYNFIFTDTDVIWLRNPFPVLTTTTSKIQGFDIQLSVDTYNGDSSSTRNPINTGFYFVKSNNKTISLFNKWYGLKDRSGGAKEQDVLQYLTSHGVLKEMGLKPRFLDTKYFSGFCLGNSDIRSVITVHANCCRYIKAKVTDLSQLLRDWGTFKVTPANETSSFRWSPHVECRNSWNAKYENP